MSDARVEMTRERNGGDATIHDIGYRRYDGALLGAAGAWRTLWWQGFRALFGLGRGAKSKIVPVFVLGATLIPAFGALTAAAMSKGVAPILYAGFVEPQIVLYVLFAAAQAPEIFSRDQHDRVLPLILTRQVTRASYASARLASLLSVLFIISLAPLLLLYIGEVGSVPDVARTFERMGGKIWPILLQALCTTWVIGTIGAALTSWTPRRSFATAAVIGVFLVAGAIAAGINDLAGVSSRVAEFINPVGALQTQARILFDEKSRAMETNPPPAVSTFLMYFAVLGLAAVSLLFTRLRRVRV